MTAPAAGRVLGVDLGRRRIGVALSDSGRTVASPYATIPAPAGGPAPSRPGPGVADSPAATTAAAVAAVAEETGATLVVVGLPLTLDGGRGPAAEAAEEVVAALRARLEPNAVPVVTHDERLTTVVAERSLRAGGRSNRRRRSVVDQAAATVLLQSWLDRQRTVTHVGGAGDGTDPAAGSR